MAYCLVAFDTDRIQEYVFATGTLREIRGGSALLDWLNRERMAQIAAEVAPAFNPEEHLIYANGGSGLFLIDEQYAQPFIRQVRQAYRDATNSGSITGVSVELPPGWTIEQPIPGELACLGYRLRCAKDAPALLRTDVSHALLKTCDSCGTEYAQVQDTLPSGEQQWICRSCSNKRESNKHVKNLVRRLTTYPEQLDADNPQLWHRLLAPFQAVLQRIPYELPDDFDDIGEQSIPKHYFGLIYADGNAIGRHLEHCDTLPQRKHFARVVDRALDQAVIAVIREHLLTEPENLAWGFDVLLAGGDDLVMVTTADDALQAASLIATTFQEYTSEHLGTTLSLSIGVALAHAKFPFHSLYGLAKDLCKFAKKERVKRNRTHAAPSEQSLINFQVVNASNSLHFKDEFKEVFVQEVKRRAGPPLKYVRTLRPYYVSHPQDWRKLDTLLAQIRRLQEAHFPRNKLQLLRELAWWSYGDGVLEGKALQNRLSQEHRNLLREIIAALSPPQALQIDILPWFKGQDACYTPFVDLAELYELYAFLPGGEL